MKKIFILLLLLFASDFVFSQCEKTGNVLIDSTIMNIYHYQDDPDIISKTISEQIGKIIYSIPDSIVTIENKLDIFHLMIMFQRYSTEQFRIGFLNNDSLKFSNEKILYTLPLLFCHYCNEDNFKNFSENDSVLILKKIETLSPDYQKYYKSLLKEVCELKQNVNQNNLNFLLGTYKRNLFNLFINKITKREYLCFKNYFEKKGKQ